MFGTAGLLAVELRAAGLLEIGLLEIGLLEIATADRPLRWMREGADEHGRRQI